MVCICQSQFPNLSLHPSLPPGSYKFVFSICNSTLFADKFIGKGWFERERHLLVDSKIESVWPMVELSLSLTKFSPVRFRRMGPNGWFCQRWVFLCPGFQLAHLSPDPIRVKTCRWHSHADLKQSPCPAPNSLNPRREGNAGFSFLQDKSSVWTSLRDSTLNQHVCLPQTCLLFLCLWSYRISNA